MTWSCGGGGCGERLIVHFAKDDDSNLRISFIKNAKRDRDFKANRNIMDQMLAASEIDQATYDLWVKENVPTSGPIVVSTLTLFPIIS